MHQTLTCFFLVCLMLPASLPGAREILLLLEPENDAPVIAKITATEKVVLDAAPAGRNADQGWRQLSLPTPFEGYVPVATLDKNTAIIPGTPVHYLPTAQSARITQVEDDDRYEVIREQNDWVTVRFYKSITGYFSDAPTEAVAIDFDASAHLDSLVSPASDPFESTFAPSDPEAQLPQQTRTARQNQAPAVEPLTVPAPRRPIKPDAPISQLDPKSLPPENVIWKPASTARNAAAARSDSERESDPASHRVKGSAARGSAADPASTIMVTPDQTQARETTQALGPAKTPRLLTGQLVRQIEVDGPGYPIRLKSPEGRLIAFVDLSGIYLPNLDPYLGQRVYLRGQVHPLPNTSGQLVILAETLRLSN